MKLVKGSRLYLNNYPTLKYDYKEPESEEEGYELGQFYEKIDNEEFGWWSLGGIDPNKDIDSQRYVRMDTKYVESINYRTLFNIDDWKRLTKVEHKSLKFKGVVNKILFDKNNIPYIGVRWEQGQKSKYQIYFWNRFDKLRILSN